MSNLFLIIVIVFTIAAGIRTEIAYQKQKQFDCIKLKQTTKTQPGFESLIKDMCE